MDQLLFSVQELKGTPSEGSWAWLCVTLLHCAVQTWTCLPLLVTDTEVVGLFGNDARNQQLCFFY